MSRKRVAKPSKLSGYKRALEIAKVRLKARMTVREGSNSQQDPRVWELSHDDAVALAEIEEKVR